jgi:hypothetical protein
MLTACDANAGTISITNEQETAYIFIVNASTTFVGDTHDHSGSSTARFGLTQLCALLNKVKVQVQATASTSGFTVTLTAEKITVEGPGTGDGSGNEPTEIPDAHPTGTHGAHGE